MPRGRKALTLIETLEVLSILILMTSMLVLYNRTGERQILLLREKARLIGAIFRAKSLALNTFIDDDPACGYGVHITDRGYFIFRDKAISCRTSDHVYSEQSDEKVAGSEIELVPAFQFGQVDVTDIVFVPPNPAVFLNGGTATREGMIEIMSIDTKSHVSVIINNAGQVSGE